MSDSTPQRTAVEVALPIPPVQTFTYTVEGPAPTPGTRVKVRFGPRRLVGWVVGPGADRELARVRPVDRVLERTPSVPADVLALCRWIADYYVAPLGMVLRAALPAALSRPARPEATVRTRRVLRIAMELPSLQQREALFGRARRQRECYEALEAAGGVADGRHLAEQLGFSASVLKGLVDKGVARWDEERVERDPFADLPAVEPPRHEPTAAQAAAIGALTAAARTDRPGVHLLLGVTGSGKTEVYIELLREVVERQGRGAIVLVPEIALTPQTVARFRAWFGENIAVLHSALSEGERYDAWRALGHGTKRIAIGARSAIFAPVAELGAIVVDEEHEATYKQSEAPRYHAREVAVMRAAQAGAVCLLGSATPSLESWSNASAGKYTLHRLPERVADRPMPPVRTLDLRERRPGAGSAPRSITPDLAVAIGRRLDRGEQTILLLNRRGYATFVQCRECGAVWHCERCNVTLTYHRARRRLVCHYCFHEEAPPTRCDACGSDALAFRGTGTEQVEQEVGEAFPAARVARMDMDTTSAKWSHHEILTRVEKGQVDILLGTQMIAKGLDFPNVTLVGVVNADVAMNLPDFRAAERTFQLLTQVAGRAGRGPLGGEVLVQTALPDHYAIRAAVDHAYERFAERELAERREPLYPPHLRLANVVLSGPEELAVAEEAERAVGEVRGRVASQGAAAVAITGPAPCAIDRIRGRWRWHFLLRSVSAGALGRACTYLSGEHTVRGAGARLIVDRDPVSLL
ncbi:MAG: primosomal protein N' [Gemmatimonadota bacterium]